MAVALIVIGVQHCNRSFEVRDQQHETKDYISKLEQSVFSETRENDLSETRENANRTSARGEKDG